MDDDVPVWAMMYRSLEVVQNMMQNGSATTSLRDPEIIATTPLLALVLNLPIGMRSLAGTYQCKYAAEPSK